MEDVVSTLASLEAAYGGRRVLITGNTGFKGSWLALWLTRLGAEVHGYSDSVPTEPSHFVRLALPYQTTFADVADEVAIRNAVQEVRPEIVFHLAAQSLVRRSYSDPFSTYRTNVLGTLAVFEACRAIGSVRAIVSATTDKVYRNKEWHWGYREIDELGGADPYSASKSCVEIMSNSYRRSFLADGRMLLASVRAGNVIGGGDWAEDRLIPDIVRAAYGDRMLTVRNPASTRPWQHVLDPLSGYLQIGARLLDGDAAAADAWNFGPVSKRRLSVGEIVDGVQQQLPTFRVEHAPDRSGRHESSLLELDSTKASTQLGWGPLWEDQMLDRSLEWYRAFYTDGRLISDEQLSDYGAMLQQAA